MGKILCRFLRITLFFFYTFQGSIASAQEAAPRRYLVPEYASTFIERNIIRDSLRKDVYALASDSMQGREVNTEGILKSAWYIATELGKGGIMPSKNLAFGYMQDVRLKSESIKFAQIEINGKRYQNGLDMVVFNTNENNLADFTTREIVFGGYGIDDPDYSDFPKKADIKNKVVIILDKEPFDKKKKSLLTQTESASDWSENFNLKKIKLLSEYGARAVLIVSDSVIHHQADFKDKIFETRVFPFHDTAKVIPPDYCPSMFISSQIAKNIYGADMKKIEKSLLASAKKKPGEPLSIKGSFRFNIAKDIKYTNGYNVIGMVEGADPVLKNEWVIISAHYDHLGTRDGQVFYGADDNATGVSGVLSIIKAFQKAKDQGLGPARSVMAIFFTGEEKGLLGSKYYVLLPEVPLKNTIANLNIDMIGRKDKKHDDFDYIYIIGSDKISKDLHNINESCNILYTHLDLDYTFNDPKDPQRLYYRSDHYNFAKNDIPVIFYFSGLHSDYHTPNDSPEKINYDILEKRTKLVFHTAWNILNRQESLEKNN